MYSCEGEVIYFVFQRTCLPFFKAQIKNHVQAVCLAASGKL